MSGNTPISNVANNNPIIHTDTCGGILVDKSLGPIFEIAKQHDNVEQNGKLELNELTQFFEHLKRALPPEEYEKFVSINDTHYVYDEYNDNGELVAKTFVGNESSMQTKFYYKDGKPYKVVENVPFEGKAWKLEYDLVKDKAHMLYENEEQDYVDILDEKKSDMKKILHSENRNIFEKIYHKIFNFFEHH